MIKAAIFDFNGTLFFDTEKHQQAWRLYGEQLLGRPVTENEFQTSMLGRNNTLILTFLLGRQPTPHEVLKMGGEKEAKYRELCLKDPDNFHLAPGAEEFLTSLSKASIPMTIATSSDRENLDFYFRSFDLNRWFQKENCIYEDGSFPGKPAPDIYLRAAQKLGIPPKDCTVFEDALSGICSAQSAGIGKIIAVASSAPPVFFKESGAYKVISDYTCIDLHETINNAQK